MSDAPTYRPICSVNVQGPRNVLEAMYKRRNGTYRDFGEARLASWMGTTTAGTARANIARALSSHFKNLPSWSTYRPRDNFVFGYVDTAGHRKVWVGEEWDPKFIYGKLPRRYGGKNPYGNHLVDLSEAFLAVDHSAIHGIVA